MAEITTLNRFPELLKDSLAKYDYVWVKLIGKSMLPFFKSGILIAVRKADVKDIQIGDIALFKKDDIIIAHRVIKKIKRNGRSFLRAKSDLTFALEPPINYEELIGKVVAFKRSQKGINIDNFIFRFLGLGAGLLFPFVARAHFALRSATNYVVKG